MTVIQLSENSEAIQPTKLKIRIPVHNCLLVQSPTPPTSQSKSAAKQPCNDGWIKIRINFRITMCRWAARLKTRSNAANVGWVMLAGLVNFQCAVINECSIFLTGDDINNDSMDFLLDMPNKFTLVVTTLKQLLNGSSCWVAFPSPVGASE